MSVQPNPFNPQTTISFDLPTAGRAEVRIYSVRGELVTVLGGEARTAGSYREVWNGADRQGRDAPSGSYFARLYVDGQVRGEVTKMSLLR
jgi:flagellar hook assembly protein FlgD